MRFRRLMYYSPESDGDGGPEDDPAQKALEGLLGRMGDANKVALHLLDENYKYRQKIRDLSAKVPGDGVVTISAEEKALLDRYRELGDPDSIISLKDQLTRLERDRVVSEAAQAHGFKPSVLSRLIGEEKIELREEVQDGVKKPYAVVIQNGRDPIRLDDYAKSEWEEFLPSLSASEESQGGSGKIPFTRQARGKGPASGSDLVSSRIEQMTEARKKRKNPLLQQ